MASPEPEAEEVREGKIYAVVAYLSLLCIIPLIVKKENPFVLFHGKQGLVIFIGEVALFILSIAFPFLWRIGLLLLLSLSFLGIIAALQGRSVRLPVVAKIADRITL
jgi:uncharacterized membrane protein